MLFLKMAAKLYFCIYTIRRASSNVFLNTERSHKRETPPAYARQFEMETILTTKINNCQVGNESVNCMSYPSSKFFFTLNFPDMNLKKEALVSLLYMVKTESLFASQYNKNLELFSSICLAFTH